MQSEANTPKPEPPPPGQEQRTGSQTTAPRGNPETDQQSVQKGREQLDKVSGH